MHPQNFIQNKDSFPDTHFFVYKNKQYPIKYDFFKISSKYFQNKLYNASENRNIQLVNDNEDVNLNLTEDTILNFIKYVHHEPIPLTNENVIEINYLAKKYEVSSLIELTNDYISAHHEELSLQMLTKSQNDSIFSMEIYEDAISKHFLDYVDNDRLLTIGIPSLYRIVSKFLKEAPESAKSDTKIFGFLFKCLDKYGKRASVLFSNIDFGDYRSDRMNLLLTKYSHIFDFNFINAEIQKSLHERQSELIKLQVESQIMEEDSRDQINSKLEPIRNELSMQLFELMKNGEDNFNKMKSEFEQEINSLKNEVKELKQKIATFDERLSEKVTPRLSIQFDGNFNNCFCGIIYHLTKECKGNVSDKKVVLVTASSTSGNCYPKNAVDLHDIYNYFHSNNQQNDWLKYDFVDKKIRPTMYAIRSRNLGKGNEHLKNWVIEGSNTNSENGWKILDIRNNITTLDNSCAKDVFFIQNQLYEDEYFRYLRLRITGETTNPSCKFNYIKISALEFFGALQ